jgi:hypothetical protein
MRRKIAGLDMNLDQVFAELRSRNVPVPKPLRLPSVVEVDDAEERIGVRFHPDFRRYLLEVSNVTCGTREPVTLSMPNAHTHLIRVVENARTMGVPPGLIPICEDNSDFYCVNESGQVVFWSHDGYSHEKWASVADWIATIWLDE